MSGIDKVALIKKLSYLWPYIKKNRQMTLCKLFQFQFFDTIFRMPDIVPRVFSIISKVHFTDLTKGQQQKYYGVMKS